MSAAPKSNDRPVRPQQGLDGSTEEALQQFEKLVADLAAPKYIFRLYVAGNTARSTAAIANVRRICDRYLAGRYELEVIDVYQQPASSKQAQLVAVPTLIKELPLPAQRFVGDMSNTERLVIGLNLRP
jgi:circadian clock protein KaiB